MEFLLLAVCVMSPHSEGMNLFSSGGGRKGKRRKGGIKNSSRPRGGKEWNGGKILGPIEYPPQGGGGGPLTNLASDTVPSPADDKRGRTFFQKKGCSQPADSSFKKVPSN